MVMEAFLDLDCALEELVHNLEGEDLEIGTDRAQFSRYLPREVVTSQPQSFQVLH